MPASGSPQKLPVIGASSPSRRSDSPKRPSNSTSLLNLTSATVSTDLLAVTAACQIVEICFKTMRTRSSTIASRISCSSFALPSTSVES